MDSSKPWYLSKVIWLNLLTMIAVIVPASNAWVSSHLIPDGGVGLFAAVNFFLRVFSTNKAIE